MRTGGVASGGGFSRDGRFGDIEAANILLAGVLFGRRGQRRVYDIDLGGIRAFRRRIHGGLACADGFRLAQIQRGAA
ncbi:MAG: hypothetical protein WDN06_00035 [Asticcacaulis sp.]